MMNRKRIYLCLAHMSGNEMKYIQDAFDTNWVVPLGPNVNGFEKDLESFVGQDKKVIALGGVSLANIETVKDLGFGGAALLGDIWYRTESLDFDEYIKSLTGI